MAVTFFLTFTVGDWLKEYLELAISWLSDSATSGLEAVQAGDILTSLVVSSCAVLFGIVNASSPEGMTAFTAALNGIGFGPLNAFCFMVFCLLYIPCAASLATIRKESGSWAWMGFTAVFQLVVAWVVTFIVYHIGLLII